MCTSNPCAAELVLFKQMTQAQDRRLVRCRRDTEVHAHELAHRTRLIEQLTLWTTDKSYSGMFTVYEGYLAPERGLLELRLWFWQLHDAATAVARGERDVWKIQVEEHRRLAPP